jgi:hypothetical protein
LYTFQKFEAGMHGIKKRLITGLVYTSGVKLAARDKHFCGPDNTWARIFKHIGVKQLGNESLIKILSFVRGRTLNLKV